MDLLQARIHAHNTFLSVYQSVLGCFPGHATRFNSPISVSRRLTGNEGRLVRPLPLRLATAIRSLCPGTEVPESRASSTCSAQKVTHLNCKLGENETPVNCYRSSSHRADAYNFFLLANNIFFNEIVLLF